MRDEEILKNIQDISKWLDSIIVEVNKINETLEDVLANVPVSVKAWKKSNES
jgi:hypothetical protein